MTQLVEVQEAGTLMMQHDNHAGFTVVDVSHDDQARVIVYGPVYLHEAWQVAHGDMTFTDLLLSLEVDGQEAEFYDVDDESWSARVVDIEEFTGPVAPFA